MLLAKILLVAKNKNKLSFLFGKPKVNLHFCSAYKDNQYTYFNTNSLL
jgi:hypothetical protein